MFDPFTFFSLLTSIFILILGIFVYSKGSNDPIKRSWSAFCFSMAIWSFGLFAELVSTSKNWALFFTGVYYCGAIFIPSTYLNFINVLLQSFQKQKTNAAVRIAYLVSFGLLLLSLTPYFTSDLEPKFNFRYWQVPGKLYFLFPLYFICTLSYSQYLLFKAFRKTKSNPRLYAQVKLILIGSLFAIIGGSTNFLLIFNLPVYPFGHFFIVLYPALITYAILRHQLMDIEVIIRRTLVFAGIFSTAFGIFGFVTFLTQELLSTYIAGRTGRILSLGISVFLIVLVYDPLRTFLINLTDKFLFQKKYDYRKLLRDASAGISQIKSLRQLLSLVTHFVTMRIRVRSAAILIHDEKNDYFKLAYMRGYGEEGWLKEEHIFSETDPMVAYLAHERVPLNWELVKDWAEQYPKADIRSPKSKKVMRYDFAAIKDRMTELRAACCVPSFLGENLRNVLILGEKKSGDLYSEEDLHVLYTLAQESAIAIENARLYDQAVEKARELELINEQLNSAQTNLLRALNDTEVANKKLRDTHAQLIHEQKMATLGRLASSVGHEVNNPLTILSMNVSRAILKYRQNPDLKVTEILDIFHKMEQNISRIKAVVNTLTGLLKKSEHGKFEALSLKLVLEETLPLVQFQTYLENLSGTEVVFDIPNNIPLIKGDLERLQEVFLNLFINAYHAMTGKRNRKITVTAREDPAHPAMVTVDFSDNGHGMGDDVMKKIFSYGFTTKPAGKGSGMGLYMCRYIIELHGGEIKVRSKLGEGTSFLITLPVAHDQSSIAPGSSQNPSAEKK